MSKEKKTIEQKLHGKKMKRPPYIIYNVLGFIWKLLFMKKYGVSYEFKTDFRKEKGPYILVSNHASRLDYIFVGVPLLPNTYNFVVGYNEYFRSHLAGVFGILKPIPKRNFTPDLYTMRELVRIIKDDGKIIIFPEGMSSITGANQPVAIGTGKFIKHFKIPVYYSLIKGGYLTATKHSLIDKPGKVEVTYDILFTPEEIDKLTPEQIEDKMNKALYHDDYKWNKEKKYKYKTNGKAAESLEDLLYYCPKCHKEFVMKGEGDVFKCTHCGNGATIDDTYTMTPLDETCIIPDTQTEWVKLQRELVKKQIQDPNFELKEEVELGMLPDYKLLKDQKTSEIVGKGVITLNKEGLTYVGTKNGEEFTFHISTDDVPTYGMCTDMSRFYTFYKGVFMEFYPKTRCVEKWFLATEELHRLNGGKWQDFKFER